MRWAAFQALLSHWRRHPLQLLTLLIGLAMATGLWTGVQAINAQARLSYDQAAQTLGQDRLLRLEGGLTLADFATARRAGFTVSPVLEGRLPGSTLRLFGVDPFTLPPRGPATPDLTEPDLLRAFLAGEVVFASSETLARLPDSLPPGRILDGLAPGLVMADILAVQTYLRTEDITRLLISDPDLDAADALADLFPQAVLSQPQSDSDLDRLTDSFHLNLTAFGLLAFAVGLFIVHATIGLAFEQRRPLVRTLRALGLPSGALVTLLGAELALLTLVAGGAGVLLGYLVAAALLPGVAATLSGLYGAAVGGSLTLSPAWWLSGLAMAGVGMVTAGGHSLWHLSRLPILAPAMPRAWARAQGRSIRMQGLAGCALIAAAAALIWLGSGLLIGFMALGGLLVGAAFLLPPILVSILDFGTKRAQGALSQWLWSDTRQQVPGLSLALMALLLALSANIGVSTMVGSFRETFTGWLDQRLAAELYVTASSPAQAEQLIAWAEPRVSAVLPGVMEDVRLNGTNGQALAIADDPTYRQNWPLLDQVPNVWEAFAAGQGVLINEQLARRDSLWAGGQVAFGADGTRRVLGVYSDYGNPLPQAMMELSAFFQAFPDAKISRFALRLPPDDAADLAQEMVTTFDLSPQSVVPQAEIKAFSMRVFEQTFAVTAALNVLTLGVAAFALWASLTTLGTMRLPQVAPVWALGQTRRTLALADLGRALLLGSLTACLAVPVGI
ncbi:MAG: ABC transporter permease, partial [Pseudomonadota bacterium]